MKEGVDGCQTDVARLGLIAPVLFHVVQETANERGIQV
jgi:hypothetical protein